MSGFGGARVAEQRLPQAARAPPAAARSSAGRAGRPAAARAARSACGRAACVERGALGVGFAQLAHGGRDRCVHVAAALRDGFARDALHHARVKHKLALVPQPIHQSCAFGETIQERRQASYSCLKPRRKARAYRGAPSTSATKAPAKLSSLPMAAGRARGDARAGSLAEHRPSKTAEAAKRIVNCAALLAA